MFKRKLAYRVLAALGVAMALALIHGSNKSTAVGTASAAPLAEADLSSEERTLNKFLDDWSKFNKKWVELGKKNSVTHIELEPLDREASDLKRRLADVQNAVRNIVTKLKAANQWNDFDAIVLSKTTNTKAQAHFRKVSLRQVLDEATSQLTNDQNEISSPVESLRSKLSARVYDDLRYGNAFSNVRIVTATYQPAAFKFSLACRLAQVRLGVSGFIHGNPTDAALDALDCTCSNSNCFVW